MYAERVVIEHLDNLAGGHRRSEAKPFLGKFDAAKILEEGP